MIESTSRRRFLASAASFAGVSTVPVLAGMAATANAAASGDYRALVCVFLNGGNDAYNTVLATDATSWEQYQRFRSSGMASIALGTPASAGGPLPLGLTTQQPGRSFGLHPNLGAIKALFDAGRVAIVSNVGPLVQPTTLAEYKNGTAQLPRELFSHNDQQSVWQSSRPEGAAYGWGGRLADMIAAGNSNNAFTCISTAENAVFVTGRNIGQYQMSASGVPAVLSMDGTLFSVHNHPLASIIGSASNNLIEKEYVATTQRALETQGVLAAAMATSGNGGVPAPSNYINPVTNVAAVNPLAVQLQTVARVIAARSVLGVKRQVFFVSLGGFDTHANQRTRHADLMAKLAHGLSYFDSITGNLMGSNMREQITTFTASDFGRTLVTNGDGTDHGWGGHHFVMGGAVRGRDMYGYFPAVGLNHAHDVGRGALLPNLAVEQYGATLGRWFGVSDSQLLDVFPNLVNFKTRNIGFMS
ncbi:uncharacterized protein (DUF1501 family) [Pseudoduganella flava]|uniref:DUF1501 domain-containing protein n=1 Tax=Pseudoduganella flava TaxID=871742 RepID=A0A562Q4Y7_9BURK|nr:DUF1501 domain-containing protein [Pseudoduganella flava]QGZ41789.1 DUF1501 domain-containing protein [Pseudoduganella flava]TWI51794.1 uncharacterized protein (DUF1501 family) [Pseudoduganella flava]